jgi:protein-tyrosine-phosphatase
MRKKILILGSNDRASLACARSINKEYDVYIARFTKFKSEACYSNTVKESFYVGTGSESISIVLSNIKSQHKKYNFDFILPVTDEALIIGEELVTNNTLHDCTILIPEISQLQLAQDKYYIKQLCENIEGLRFPETNLITQLLFTEFDLKKWSFPLYVKTQRSAFKSKDALFLYAVKKINSVTSLSNYLRDVLEHVDVLVQKPVIGFGLGLNVLAYKGEVQACSINERLHEPKGGGGGVYRKTRKPTELEYSMATKIVKQLNWTGPLMIELKKVDEGFFLMELNCRFWGSLNGTIFSGHDLPLSYIKMMDKQCIELLPEAKMVTSRNLLKDIAWTLKNNKPFELFKILLSPIDVFAGKDIYDVERLNDIKPAFFQILVKFNQYSFITKLNKIAFLAACKFKLLKIKSITDEDISKKISIICKGNVNRSAFAAHYFFKMSNISIESQSTIRMEKRKVSLLAYETAAKLFDIDMGKHRSISVFGRFNDYDIFLCMDFRNVFELLEMGVAKDKIRLFSCGEVKDPHGGGVLEFEQCFNLIASEIEELVK